MKDQKLKKVRKFMKEKEMEEYEGKNKKIGRQKI